MSTKKGYKWSEEALKNHKGTTGKKHSEETKKKIGLSNSIALTGRTLSETHKNNIKKTIIKLGNKPPLLKGDKSPLWKGDDVQYSGLHDWVVLNLGKPSKCDHCGTESNRKYHWANKSREYKRNISDWIRLCVPCHIKYDKEYTGNVIRLKR